MGKTKGVWDNVGCRMTCRSHAGWDGRRDALGWVGTWEWAMHGLAWDMGQTRDGMGLDFRCAGTGWERHATWNVMAWAPGHGMGCGWGME